MQCNAAVITSHTLVAGGALTTVSYSTSSTCYRSL